MQRLGRWAAAVRSGERHALQAPDHAPVAAFPVTPEHELQAQSLSIWTGGADGDAM